MFFIAEISYVDAMVYEVRSTLCDRKVKVEQSDDEIGGDESGAGMNYIRNLRGDPFPHDINRLLQAIKRIVTMLTNRRQNRMPAGNSRLPQWRIMWLSQVQGFRQSLCLVDSAALTNFPLRQAARRERQC
jgi:hypothetical protein